MLDGEDLAWEGEVEHVENNGFGTTVLATMDRVDDFDQRLAFMESTLITVLADDGQVALLDDTVVDGCVVMPACDGSNGKGHAQYG